MLLPPILRHRQSSDSSESTSKSKSLRFARRIIALRNSFLPILPFPFASNSSNISCNASLLLAGGMPMVQSRLYNRALLMVPPGPANSLKILLIRFRSLFFALPRYSMRSMAFSIRLLFKSTVLSPRSCPF
eukprot:UN1340